MAPIRKTAAAAASASAALTPEQREKNRRDAMAPDQRLPGFADWLKGQRQDDMKEGETWAADKFGAGNPEMAAVLEQRRQRALGLNGAEVGLMRDRGMQGINQQLATNMRQLRGLQGASGLSGGATLGQALPALSHATQARAGLETDIGLADMQRRSEALKDYESTLTGERAGALGAQLGFAGMGASDRSGGMQYLLGKDWLERMRGETSPPSPAAIAGENTAIGRVNSSIDHPDIMASLKNYFGRWS